MKLRQLINNFKNKHFKAYISVLVSIPIVLLAVILSVALLPKKSKDISVNSNVSLSSILPQSSAVSVVSELENKDAQTQEYDPEILKQDVQDGAKINISEISSEKGLTNGIDVSYWQGKIDWAKVKKSGIDFAFIRIGFRGENGQIYKDSAADYNIQQAEKNGILVGVYFFSTAVNTAEAKQEANYVINAVKSYSISYPVVYDCEGFLNSSSRMYNISAYDRTQNALSFLNAVKNAGYDAMFYGGISEISNTDCWNISAIEQSFKVWVAGYPSVTYPEIHKPNYNGRCDAWQYTNKGKIDGISGNVDTVVAYFVKEKADPKDKSAKTPAAVAPLTDEEKIYKNANEEVTAKIETNLRSAPSTNSEVIYLLKAGEYVKRTGVGTNGWSKLEYKGKTVYAVSSFLTTEKVSPASSNTSFVNSDDGFKTVDEQVTAKIETNLRSAPSTNSEVIYLLKAGEYVKRVGIHNNGWSKLEYNGQIVYAVSSFLTTEKITTEN